MGNYTNLDGEFDGVHKSMVLDAMSSGQVPSSRNLRISLSIRNYPSRDRLAVCLTLFPASKTQKEILDAVEKSYKRNQPCHQHETVRLDPILRRQSGVSNSRQSDSEFRIGVIDSAHDLEIHGLISAGEISDGTQLVFYIENHNMVTNAQGSFNLETSVDSPYQTILVNLFFGTSDSLSDLFVWIDEVSSLSTFVGGAWEWLIQSERCVETKRSFWGNKTIKIEWLRGLMAKSIEFIPYELVVVEGHIVLLIEEICGLFVNGHRFIAILVIVNTFMFYYFDVKNRLGDIGISSMNFSLKHIVKSSFAHGSVLHLISNMSAIAAMGPKLHHALDCSGNRWIVIYASSAVGAALLSCYGPFSRRYQYSVGASGAIYGLQGALFSLAPTLAKQSNLVQFATWAVIDTAETFLRQNGNIDIQGHVGGAVTGFAVAAFLERFDHLFGL
eukprot:jgi/Bigna1/133912/aug1.23_g8620